MGEIIIMGNSRKNNIGKTKSITGSGLIQSAPYVVVITWARALCLICILAA